RSLAIFFINQIKVHHKMNNKTTNPKTLRRRKNKINESLKQCEERLTRERELKQDKKFNGDKQGTKAIKELLKKNDNDLPISFTVISEKQD
ncbi:4683_t:CDS:2, partial [Funneliformis geosporum]